MKLYMNINENTYEKIAMNRNSRGTKYNNWYFKKLLNGLVLFDFNCQLDWIQECVTWGKAWIWSWKVRYLAKVK
jgi:hypothetical protein